MSTAIEKTKNLIRKNVPLSLIDPQEHNPNEMTDAEFNMLYDNIEETGITDPFLLRQKPDGRYSLIGGHHRWEVAKLLGFEEGPATIIDDPEFDADREKFQVVRMNVIRGRMSPDKFMKLYQSMGDKYSADVAAQLFGFVDEDQFNKLVKQMAKSVPSELKADFEKAAKEVKTIDGLSKLLNGLFTKYGDTLPYGYMLFDFGGKDSIWLRMGNETRKGLLKIGKRCVQESRTMDDVLGGLIRMAAEGQLEEALMQSIAASDPVKLSEGVEFPTKEGLNL